MWLGLNRHPIKYRLVSLFASPALWEGICAIKIKIKHFTFYIQLGIMSRLNITFAVSKSGRSYFEKFLHNLAIKDRAIILAVFQDIQKHHLSAKGCEFR